MFLNKVVKCISHELIQGWGHKASEQKSRATMLQCGLCAIIFLEQSADSGLLVPTVLEKYSIGLRIRPSIPQYSETQHWVTGLKICAT